MIRVMGLKWGIALAATAALVVVALVTGATQVVDASAASGVAATTSKQVDVHAGTSARKLTRAQRIRRAKLLRKRRALARCRKLNKRRAAIRKRTGRSTPRNKQCVKRRTRRGTPVSSRPPVSTAPGGVAEGAYDIGSPTLRDIWVNANSGSDSNSGASRDQAFRSVTAAWNSIPEGTLSGTGYRINLTGRFSAGDQPNYWENRVGSRQFPIIFQSADSPGSASMSSVNMFGSRYVYFIGLRMESAGGDIFHCEQCDHILLRQDTIRSTERGQETVKINQSQYVFIEQSDISVAEDNAVDFVSVQYGHLLANRIHDAQDWCAYSKGGSAYIRVVANEFYDCGTGGYTAGQGAGFQYMTAPWIQHEAYDIKVYNNIVHDTQGAAFGVNGGYNVMIAYNTAYHVGARAHVLEFVFGAHTCDGGSDPRCASNRAAGGWGSTSATSDDQAPRIPNRNVYVYDNVILNNGGFHSGSQQIQVHPPFSGPQQAAGNAPNPARADDNLRIRGNVIWNGPTSHPLGVGDDTGCAPSNPTCNPIQLVADNAINTSEPQLINPAGGDFKPTPGGNISSFATFEIAPFEWNGLPSAVPAGSPANSVTTDRAGRPRTGASVPGAYLP